MISVHRLVVLVFQSVVPCPSTGRNLVQVIRLGGAALSNQFLQLFGLTLQVLRLQQSLALLCIEPILMLSVQSLCQCSMW